jgi:hypothetical protein
MAKVIKTFFCIQEKKKYFPGDEYTGNRKDLSHVLEVEMEDKALQPKTRTKKRPARRKTKK